MIETATQAPEFEKGRDVAYALWGKERADQLQKKIHGAHGRVFVVVHSTMARQQMPHIAAKIDDALMRGLDAHWPVIFFEEEDGGTAQEGRLQSSNNICNACFPS